MSEGYDYVIVLDWLATHGSQRDDGRFLTLNDQLVDDSHRDTFDRWCNKAQADPAFLVPLGRLDEILVAYDVMLFEFEQWAEILYGTDGYCST